MKKNKINFEQPEQVGYNPYLGRPARDKITGFSGTITGFVQHMTGCDRYCITPKLKEDSQTPPEGFYFDYIQLEIDMTSPQIVLDPSREAMETISAELVEEVGEKATKKRTGCMKDPSTSVGGLKKC